MKKFRALVVTLWVAIFAVGIAYASVEIERVTVNGVCRAWKIYDYSGALKRVEIFFDNNVGDYYADTTVTGSIGWAASLVPPNGTIVIHPGTYLTDRTISPDNNVTIMAHGAVIKRVNQIVTTTTTGITSGVTNSIVVADNTGLRVGQSFAAIKSDNTVNTTSFHVVSSIVGTTVTFSTAFNASFSGTTDIYQAFDVLYIKNGGRVYGLEIDGNKSNWTRYRWETVTEIRSGGFNNKVEGCYIHDSPGEGIQETSYNSPWNNLPVNGYNIYRGNKLYNLNGNGIHLSATISPLIEGNYIDTTNVDGVNMAHNGGNITFSSQIRDARILNNYLYNGRAGVGQMNSGQVTNVVINNNVIRNAATYAIEGSTGTVNSPLTDITISGNKIQDSGPIYLGSTQAITTPSAPTGTTANGSPIITSVSSTANTVVGMSISGAGIPTDSVIIGVGTGTVTIGTPTMMPVNATIDNTNVTLTITGRYPQRINITNNSIVNSFIALQRMSAVTISGNTIEFYPGNTTGNGVSLGATMSGVSVTNNSFRYGNSGVNVSAAITDAVISGNAMTYGYYYGIYTTGAHTNLLIVGNTISNTSTANASSYSGIYASDGAKVKNNTINLTTGYATIRGLANAAGIIIQGNTTKNAAYNGTSKYDIRIESGNTAYIVSNNQITNPISDASNAAISKIFNDTTVGPPGTGKTFLDNVASPTTNQVYDSVNLVNANITVLLPTAVAGMSTCVVDSGTAHDIIVDVQATDNVVLVGVVGAGGVGITNASGSSTGDYVCLVAPVANKWYVLQQQGTWASQ